MVMRMLCLIALLTAAGTFGVAWATELPPEFKSLIPVYGSAKANAARYTRESVSVAFATDDAYAQVRAFYLTALKADGWYIHPAKTTAATAQPALEAVKGKRILILSPGGGNASSNTDFTIELQYPGGRE